MRAVIPVFDGRISPRLDCAQRFLLVETASGRVSGAREVVLGCRTPEEMAEKLLSLQVEALICGGLSTLYEERLRNTGLELITWVSGPVEAIIAAYCRGRLRSGQCCRGRGCQHRGGP